jgi:heme a synthase
MQRYWLRGVGRHYRVRVADRKPPCAMTQAKSQINLRRRAVRLWLWAVAALIVATVLVGGVTRLTGSGLSIIEWRPVTGTVPPLSDNAWQSEFEKYRTSSQYQLLNRGMGLGEFKTIYWWEWGHRLLGRLVGAAFLLPFLWFLWRGWIEPAWRTRLWLIFGLGAIQGAVGWWMVASGLEGRVSVLPHRLAFHLTLGCVIYAAVIWSALELSPRAWRDVPRRLRFGALALLGFVLVQIYLGALVAGLDAGLSYNTWPLIDGALVPAWERLNFLAPAWRNFFENDLLVQFNHRIATYALCLAAVLHVLDALTSKQYGAPLTGALALAGTVFLQAAVGIVTLLMQTPLSLALLHQAMAMVLLTVAVMHAARLTASDMIAERTAPQPG